MIEIERAKTADIDELLQLYFSIYGKDYPIALGTDARVMAQAMGSERYLWLVARDSKRNAIVGTCIFELDPFYKIGKVSGVAVHQDYQGDGLGGRMIGLGSDQLLKGTHALNSIYATTRTLSVAPQIMCLKQGFKALGIFPNSHRVKQFETFTLMARFADGVLERRKPIQVLPERLIPIFEVFNRQLGVKDPIAILPPTMAPEAVGNIPEPWEFEVIFAPHYVKRRFEATFTDKYDRFYPFHEPNMLISSTNGEVELYAYFRKQDQYCAITSFTKPVHELRGRLRGIINQARDLGISYIEILVGVPRVKSIETLLEAQFVPSAVYPAMMELDGEMMDFVVMSRTMEPLNFKGMKVDRSFKPYMDQYVNQWKQMYLDTLQVLE